MTPQQLKQARLDADLTQEAAAKMVYVSLATWKRWEKGGEITTTALNSYKAHSELFIFKVESLK